MVNIKQLIKDKGISQVELSRLLNEHTSVVSLLVNGKRELTETHLARLAEIFGEEVISQYDGLTDYDVAEKDVMVNIKGIITDFDLTQTDIAKIMGEPQSVVSTLANGKRKQTRQHIDTLVAHFGQEVIDKYTLPSDAYEPKVREAKVTILEPEIVEEAKELGREEVRQQMGSDVVPFLPNEYMTRPEFDIRDYVQCNGRELKHIDPRNLVAGAQLCFRVLKPSMTSDFLPGDKVFVRFLPKDAELISGDIYFIDTPARGGMIRKVEVMGDEIRLIASNPDYADIVLHKESEVYSAAVIIGLYRDFFGDSQFDINAIYKRKDEQIERALTIQGELVAEIREQSKRNNALVDKIINAND